MNTFLLGDSAKGLPIWTFEFKEKGPKVLILGGVHGDEIEGVIAAEGVLKNFTQAPPEDFHLAIIPQFNPEGILFKTRGNSNQVDLNRNLPTKDWSPDFKTQRYFPGPFPNSEKESQALTKYISIFDPQLIISLHSWNPLLNINGPCEDFAKSLASKINYKIEKDIGYPTPGCLGSYAGLERHHPTLTYEIERGLAFEEIIQVHVPAICETLRENKWRTERNL